MIRLVLSVFVLAFVAGAGPAYSQHGMEPSKFPDPSLTGLPINWFANLASEEESWAVDSKGVGRADFTLERESMRFSWTVTYKDLTSPAIRVAVHGPQTPGGEAGVLVDLGGGGVQSPVKGSTILNDGQLRYLTTDRFYINITTPKYAKGEIRGQLQRVRPTASAR